MEDMDVTPQHQRFLREAAAENELETTARINKLAFYEQATSPHLHTSLHISPCLPCLPISRINKLAFYEQGMRQKPSPTPNSNPSPSPSPSCSPSPKQAMQQQQLERQTLQSEMAATQLGISKVERDAQQGRAEAAGAVSGRRKERLAGRLRGVAQGQPDGGAHAHAHAHHRLAAQGAQAAPGGGGGMQDKESQMDADSFS